MKRIAGMEQLDFLGLLIVVFLIAGFFISTEIQPMGDSKIEQQEMQGTPDKSWFDNLWSDKQASPSGQLNLGDQTLSYGKGRDPFAHSVAPR